MLVLFETPAGHALFKVLDEGKLKKPEDIYKCFANPELANKHVKLKAFNQFEDSKVALAAATALVESKLDSGLKKFLKKHIVKKSLSDQLAVADTKLGGIIKKKLSIDVIHNNVTMEIMRGIRGQLNSLVEGLSPEHAAQMALSLSHSLSRYKLKFSPDKVDTMIVQAIGLLDDLDKEINTYAMRVKEWYGWHFPEMSKIVTDNKAFAQVILKMGTRTGFADYDFSDILETEVEESMKEAAAISMGTDITEDDLKNIQDLSEQVLSLTEYRGQLFEYLQNRMRSIAPNLTCMVGELVGARLISHAGSLMNLAKQPASTVQILGAEKALFRALKTKSDTPKYGLIYHASLIGQASAKNKGKVSRVLASKAALCIRVDALGESSEATIGIELRAKVEARVRQLEGGSMLAISGAGAARSRTEKYDAKTTGTGEKVTAGSSYNAAADSTLVVEKSKKKKRKADDGDEEKPKKKKKKADGDKKKKKKKKKRDDADGEVKKKKKKKKKAEK